MFRHGHATKPLASPRVQEGTGPAVRSSAIQPGLFTSS
jgi:hypothetical protein